MINHSKNKGKVIRLLILILLLIKPVSALNVNLNEVKLLYQGREVTSLRPGLEVRGALLLNISNEDVRVILNARNLSRRNSVREMNCVDEGDNKICTNSIYIDVDSNQEVLITIINQSNESDKKEIIYSFNIMKDNEKPYIEKIESSYGDFLKKGINEVKLYIKNGPVSNGEVYIKVNNRLIKASNCSTDECSFQLILNCRDREEVNIYGSNPSKDDAGNYFDYHKGIARKKFICDNTAPVIEKINISSDNDLGFLAGSNIVIKAYISDISKVVMNVSDSEVEGIVTECEEDLCEAKIPIKSEGPRTEKLKISFIDSTKNVKEIEKDVKIDKGVARENLNIRIKKAEIINKVPADLLSRIPYKTFIRLDIDKDNPASRIVKISSRAIIHNGDEVIARAVTENAIISDDSIYIPIILTQSEDYNENTEIDLTLKVYSKIGRKIYLKPSFFNVSINIPYSNKELLYQELEEIRDKKDKEIKKTIERYRSITLLIRKVYDLGGMFCKANKVINEAQGVLDVSGSLLVALSKIPYIGSALEAPKQAVEQASKGINKVITSEIGRKTATFCSVIGCEKKYLNVNIWGINGDNEFENIIREIGGEASPDSLAYGMTHLCPYSFVISYTKLVNMQCNKYNCYEKNLLVGELDLTTCDKEFHKALCREGLKELASFHVVTRFITNAASYLNHLATWRGAISAGGSVLFTYLQKYVCNGQKGGLYFICMIPQDYEAVSKLTKSIRSLVNSFSNLPQDLPDGCQLTEQILENKEKIDRAYIDDYIFSTKSIADEDNRIKLRIGRDKDKELYVYADRVSLTEGFIKKEKGQEKIISGNDLKSAINKMADPKEIARRIEENRFSDIHKDYIVADKIGEINPEWVEETKQKYYQEILKGTEEYKKQLLEFGINEEKVNSLINKEESYIDCVAKEGKDKCKDKEKDLLQTREQLKGVVDERIKNIREEVIDRLRQQSWISLGMQNYRTIYSIATGIEDLLEIKDESRIKFDAVDWFCEQLMGGTIKEDISQAEVTSTSGTPSALINAYAYKQPYFENNELRYKYIYVIKYHIENPMEDRNIRGTITINNKVIENINVDPQTPITNSINYTSDELYNKACMKIRNGGDIFFDYPSSGICTKIRVIQE